jgi:uncharacterized membrane protein YfcA
MTVTNIAILLGTGLGVGFAGGLLGVGGSFIMTPVQYMIFTNMGLPVDTAIKLSFGTSLAVILPTAASGTWRHKREGAVWWDAALIIGGCGLASAFGGATLAAYLPGAVLKIIFGVAILAAGARMLSFRPPLADIEPKSDPRIWAACGVLIGLVSGLIGIGGGMLAVPLMVLVLKFNMHNAIATSLAVVMITSIGGTVGYMVNGLGVPGTAAPFPGLRSSGDVGASGGYQYRHGSGRGENRSPAPRQTAEICLRRGVILHGTKDARRFWLV